jgi:primosomal protein N' (replication factor Y) (superfamily II helicase)
VAKGPKDQAVSERLPVARVAVDISLAHLDRPFDYLVPARLDQAAVPGCRVRVRFAGQLVDGYLLERTETSEHQGKLARLERVTSPEPVLTPEIFDLARAVADRYAGTLADVLRLAIPPRHAAAERDAPQAGTSPAPEPARPEPGSWSRYPNGAAFLSGLAEGRPVRAAWSALPGSAQAGSAQPGPAQAGPAQAGPAQAGPAQAGPAQAGSAQAGPGWPAEIAVAAATTAAAGRGVVIVVPHARDLDRVDAALTEAAVDHACLAAELGPAERYRRWLTVRRGLVRVVAGTRAAMFAPVAGLGLVVLWDDGDDLHAEPRAPYPNAREVLALRAHRTGAAALIGGFARTTELTQLVAGGWARPLAGSAEALRQAAPRVRAAPDEAELARDAAAMTARLPSLALRTARGGLAQGPVLVQVPRRGYLAAVACARCRAQARCATCAGPLEIAGSHGTPGCRWCGALATDWACARCGSGQLRALVTGAARTAEELGRAFPGVPVRTSGGQHVLAVVPAEPALVIATPGAEPVAPGGYAAALLLDGWALLGRPSLRAAEEALRRWLNAAALVRPAAPVVVLAEAALPAVQALIRWDPVTFSERELAERAELGFPPAVRMAAVTGPPEAVSDFVGTLSSSEGGLPDQAEVLGPIPLEGARGYGGRAAPHDQGGSGGDRPPEASRALIRIRRRDGLELARALHAAQATRSARKDGGAIRVQLDPAEVA